MESVIAFLQVVIDPQNWDEIRNPSLQKTIAALLTAPLTLVVMWGFWQQIRTIANKRSIEGVSPFLIGYCCIFFLTFAFFGVTAEEGVLIAVVFTAAGYLPLVLIILGQIWWYGRVGERIIASGMFCAVIALPFMLGAPYQHIIIWVVTIGMIVSAAHQPLLMWVRLKAGERNESLNGTFVVTQLASVSVWLGYGIVTLQPLIIVLNLGLFLVFCATCYLSYTEPQLSAT